MMKGRMTQRDARRRKTRRRRSAMKWKRRIQTENEGRRGGEGVEEYRRNKGVEDE